MQYLSSKFVYNGGVFKASRQNVGIKRNFIGRKNQWKRSLRGYADAASDKVITLDVVEDVAFVRINDTSSKVNTLNKKLIPEFRDALKTISQSPEIKAAVVISSKPGSFIAGADIAMLSECKSAHEVENLAREGQEVFNELENSTKPFVAAINGNCLGGGLEFALACHYRIATDHPSTKLGLPEVKLGILPGSGGTQRLPRLIGLPNAMPIMLTGSNVFPSKAKKMGLVDQVVKAIGPGVNDAQTNTMNLLEKVAFTAAKDLIAKGKKPERKIKGNWLVNKVLNETSFGRNFVFGKAKEGVMKQTLGNYPAPLAIIDTVRYGLENGVSKGLEKERRSFGELAQTEVAKSLMGIFFGQTACRKNTYGKPETKAQNVGVLGAGLMGAGIAQVTIKEANTHCVVKDVNDKGLERGVAQISKNFERPVKKRIMTTFERDQILSKLATTLSYDSLKNSDIIIEAVLEDIKVKHAVLEEIEKVVPEHCIFASNTSALPISEIAKASKRPENVIGMHYFSPVDKMPLLEIITTDQTSPETTSRAVQLGLDQGKTVIVVKDGPGFYTTRILGPMLAEVFELLLSGVTVERLDKVMQNYGFPVGPVQLIDEVGIDVGHHVAAFLGEHFPERMNGDMRAINELVERGFLGRKTNKGFFVYENGKRKGINAEAIGIFNKYAQPAEISDNDIALRLTLKMTNEAIYCLQDGILANAVDGDIGAVFGLGFPPFRGGPFRYADNFGHKELVAKMEEFVEKYGKRFEPCPLLKNSTGPFHQ
eukprot:TRINITY_DN10905_c0_g1_i1.p1 TRINITY_DN10905_c0_g1~~TRINITY_DN10905_c0_g1_i1.p1  ORF type:complete len:766 (-),score=237.92 TRINITY_DN10905_c0_g1_i1:56-2353(-)